MERISTDRALWLARCVLPHEAALRAWLRRRRVGEADIDDIVQETYARLASLERVEPIRDPRSYAFQVAWSIHVSAIRKANVVSIRHVAQMEELNLADMEASPERVAEDRDELEQLMRAIASLPERCRVTFLLRRVDGLSHRETAEKLGVSEGTVEKHMAKAIRHLMDVFGRGGRTAIQSSKRRKNVSGRHDSKIERQRD